MINVNIVNPTRLIEFVVGSGGVTKGALCVVDSNTAIEGAAGIATQIIIGVAADSYDEGDIGLFYPLTGVEMEIDVDTTGTKTSFVAADVGQDFDISVSSHNFFLDPDDATGPLILSSYDNDRNTAMARVNPLYLYVG